MNELLVVLNKAQAFAEKLRQSVQHGAKEIGPKLFNDSIYSLLFLYMFLFYGKGFVPSNVFWSCSVGWVLLRALEFVEKFQKDMSTSYDTLTEYAGEIKSGGMKADDSSRLDPT